MLDSSVHPPLASNVEYVLDLPDADDLIESFPVFLVTEPLAARLSQYSELSFEPVTVRPGDNYLELFGDAPHKPYVRLIVGHGRDAWIDDALLLCVCEQVMGVLRDFDLRRCDVSKVE